MRIGIVTVTYNSSPVLEEFLSSLKSQTHQDYVLYVVDNASADNTCAYLEAHLPSGSIMMRNTENSGFAAGTNQGIRKALEDGCQAILLLNNDVVFGPGLLDELVKGIHKFDCDMTAPMMYYDQPKNRIWAAGGTLQPRLGFRAVHRGLNETDRGQYRNPCQITFAPFCCILIRSAVFDRVGFLDEQYFTYTEDVDYLFRCLKAGLALWYLPDARLWHKVSSLTGYISTFSVRYGARNRAYIIGKHLPSVYQTVFNVLFPGYYLLRYLTGLDGRKRCKVRLTAWAEGKRLLNALQREGRNLAPEPNRN